MSLVKFQAAIATALDSPNRADVEQLSGKLMPHAISPQKKIKELIAVSVATAISSVQAGMDISSGLEYERF